MQNGPEPESLTVEEVLIENINSPPTIPDWNICNQDRLWDCCGDLVGNTYNGVRPPPRIYRSPAYRIEKLAAKDFGKQLAKLVATLET